MSDIYWTKQKKTVFIVFADKCQQKIKDRHLFKDYKPSSDRAGSELGKSQNEVLSILFGYNFYYINWIFPTWSYLAMMFFHPKSSSGIWACCQKHGFISQVSVNSTQVCELPFLFHVSFFWTLIFAHEGRGFREKKNYINYTMGFRIKLYCHAQAGNLSVVAFT